MDSHNRIAILIAAGGISSFAASILLSTTFFSSYAFALIPFSFLMFAASALVEKQEYKVASFYAMFGGLVTFPFGGFLAMWGGFHAYKYHPIHTMKKLAKDVGAGPELVSWLRTRLDRGDMEDNIRHVLYIRGYKRDAVDSAFRKLVSG